MVSLFTSLRLLRFKEYEHNHTADVDCIKVKEKHNCSQGQYTDAKNEYFQSRCSKCEHQGRLQKNIHYVDKLFRSYKCIFISWNMHQPLVLFFSNGSIVTVELNNENNTLLNIDIDKNLCGKFLSSRIIDVVVCKNYIYVTYVEPKLTLIHINQDSPPLLAKMIGRKKGKIVGFDPKFFNFDIYPHNPRAAERKLSMNKQNDLLLVWWKNSFDDVWPWTPITLTDRINMFIYSVNGLSIELLYSVKVQDELLHATFSREYSNKLFSIEEARKDNQIIVNVCIHEIVEGQCRIVHTVILPVNGSLTAFDWSSTKDRLLVSDADGFLIIYDVNTKIPVVNKVPLKFLPMHISWHPQTCIALIVCRNNHILCVDAALNIVDFKLCYKTPQSGVLDISSFFTNKLSVQKVLWQKSAFNDTCLFFLNPEFSSFLLLKISFGCITRQNVTSLELVSQYLKCSELERAKLIYCSLDWGYESEVKFQCFSKITNYLLRRPLNLEILHGLEFMLVSFYSFIDILPKKIVKTYEPRMHHLSRCFFHRLLRHNKFKRAFLLADDIGSQDLFFDLYHVAKQRGENILAAVALRKAEQFDESSDSCSESCHSDCNSESSSSSFSDSRYGKMYRDLLHSESSENMAFKGEQSKNTLVFETSEHNQRTNNEPSCSYFVKQKQISETVPDNNSKYPDLSDHPYVTKNPFNLKLHNSPSSKHRKSHEFDSHSKYATSPYDKDQDILCHKNSEEFSSITQESENAYAASKTVHHYSYKDSNYLTANPYKTEYSQPSLCVPHDHSSVKEPSVIIDPFHSKSKICEIQHSSIVKSNESSIIEEENEEVEGTKIKLAHLGII